MTHDFCTTGTFTLAAGERRTLHAPAGSRWTLVRGAAGLSEPARWLGERMVAIDVPLGERSSHVIERGGWVVLQAAAASTLVCEVAVPMSERLRAAWRIISAGHAECVPA